MEIPLDLTVSCCPFKRKHLRAFSILVREQEDITCKEESSPRVPTLPTTEDFGLPTTEK